MRLPPLLLLSLVLAWAWPASSALAVCGDAFRDPGEQCDDGGLVPGDGCSDVCEIEPGATHAREVFGIAAGGGTLDLTISGEALSVATLADDRPEELAASLAAAAQASAPLAGLGVGAISDAGVVYTNGLPGAVSTTDPALSSLPLGGPPGSVRFHRKISATQGFFTDPLDPLDQFGVSTAPLGDLDGDGVADLLVGSFLDDDGGLNRGAVYVSFLAPDGTVRSSQKISDSAGGFGGTLANGDNFGCAVAALGDVDGDGVIDVAVGARNDDGNGVDRGAVWVLLLLSDGSVKSAVKIGDGSGGFTGSLDDADRFGWAVAGIGDRNGDGVPDLAVGAYRDDDGGTDRGAVWLLDLTPSGSVAAHTKISQTAGGFGGVIADGSLFGSALAGLGDLDGDGIDDLAIGAFLDPDGGANTGAVWIAFLDAAGSVVSEQKISATSGGLVGPIDPGDQIGRALALVGDLDLDGVREIAVGARSDDDGAANAGAIYLLELAGDGSVASEVKLSAASGGFAGRLGANDNLGQALAVLGDLGGDGVSELAAGVWADDDGALNAGAVWVLHLSGIAPDCDNGVDDDGDGLADYPDDPGCDAAGDLDERSPMLICDDGVDNDGDGAMDFDPITFADPATGSGDPGCEHPLSPLEAPRCQDGLDNDGDGWIDWDGGASAGLAPAAQTFADGYCKPGGVPAPWRNREKPSGRCGLGFEVAPLIGLGWAVRRRRARRRSD